ncbi:UbiA family prenyltransferase [Streptomyces filamentosus]|uniref:UbiA family prenyltransferase n=1 Tax=Streptomyces filamentosus TaxID=67294 RepID=UPI00123C216C|nr:UbiA family prenyltransferase [Streptomyces filamentosus]KAA6215902.1 1,4-dihydroxy-2-naphthoate prenyltransferase [Streptomyces filamentosus]
MTDSTLTTTTAPAEERPAPPPPADGRLTTYARLGKLDVYDYYLGTFIALSAVVLPLGSLTGRTAALFGVFLVGQVLLLMAMTAFDDVTGFRDGSDITNYGPDHPLRNVRRKPLVSGALTVPEALRFAWASAASAALLFAVTAALAPHRPAWTGIGLVVLWVVTLQYSYGVKLSYHGFQEVYLVALGFALVILPYGMVTGQATGFLLVQAVLFGFGPLMFGVYSNTNDVEGDRSVGRPTVAALTSERGNARFIGALSLAEFLTIATASAVGVAPWWFVLLMLPASLLRLRQYLLGFRTGDIMRARRTGFAVHRLGVVLMIAGNLLAAALA